MRDIGQLRTATLKSNKHDSAALMQDVLEKDVVEHLTSLSQSRVPLCPGTVDIVMHS